MKKGFTLIELLVVITIIATLIGVASVSYSRATKSARDARRKTDLEQIRQALETYRSENGVYAPDKTSLQTDGFITVLPVDPKENGSTFTYTYTPGSPATTSGLCANLEILTPTLHCVYQP